MPIEQPMEHERVWVEGLNRGDVSAAGAAFAADCLTHITGVLEPPRGVGAWKTARQRARRGVP